MLSSSESVLRGGRIIAGQHASALTLDYDTIELEDRHRQLMALRRQRLLQVRPSSL
jgi:hypothetical protein